MALLGRLIAVVLLLVVGIIAICRGGNWLVAAAAIVVIQHGLVVVGYLVRFAVDARLSVLRRRVGEAAAVPLPVGEPAPKRAP